MYFVCSLRIFAHPAGSWRLGTGRHRPSLLLHFATRVTRYSWDGQRFVLCAIVCNPKESIMELGSYKKTYAEAVTGSSSFGANSWSHLQTQDEERALVLAIQQSLSSTQVANIWNRFTCLYILFMKLISIGFKSLLYFLFVSDRANIDDDSKKEFKRPSEAVTKRVKVSFGCSFSYLQSTNIYCNELITVL